MTEKRVAFITGGGSGMGRLESHRLAQRGWTVAAVDVNDQGLKATAEGHEGIHTFVVDVTDSDAIAQLVERVESELGPIERVFNGAAIMPTGFLLDQGTELINKVMRIDYEGTVNVTMATLPKMIARGKGDLINFASIAGWIPTPHFGAYNAAKFAVVAFSEVLYHENRGKGVRFACVCPPPVATPLLEQATSKPKSLDTFEPIEPDHVLDEIERHLESGELFVFPNAETRRAVRMRRWLPNLIWSRVHKLEGLP